MHQVRLRSGWRGRVVRAALLAPLLLVVAGASGCAWLLGDRPLARATAGATMWHHLHWGGRSRSFVLHLPPAAAKGPVPLVLAFHGYTGSGAVLRETSHLDEPADRHGVAVAYLDGTGPLRAAGLAWNAGTCCGRAVRDSVDDVGFAAAVVDTLAKRGLVDRARVWAVGFSNGGMMALRLACERADLVLGAVDVAGAMPDRDCTPSRPVRVMLVEGSADHELRLDHLHLRRRVDYKAYSASFASALAFWQHEGRCDGVSTVDSTARVVVRAGLRCAPGAGAALVVVRGNPHAWPGGEKTWPFAPVPVDHWDASEQSLRFLLAGLDGVAGRSAAGAPNASAARP